MHQRATVWLQKTIFLGLAILVFFSFVASAKPAFAQSAPANFEEVDAYISTKMVELGIPGAALGDKPYDFVSRYFAPAKGIPEDPVTGGAHCMLTPFWAKKLGKTDFHAFQASRRGGEIICRLKGDRVELEGSCVFYLEGEVEL